MTFSIGNQYVYAHLIKVIPACLTLALNKNLKCLADFIAFAVYAYVAMYYSLNNECVMNIYNRNAT